MPTGYYGRLWKIKTGSLQETTYTWDHAGNLVQRQHLVTPTETETFTYDFLDRLIGDGGLVAVDAPGDANRDGRVSISDTTYVRCVILGLSPPTTGCDANQDGSINIGDVTCIERMLLFYQGYQYDALGNITSLNGASYTYGSGKPHAVTQVGNTVYTYDANGNMLSGNNRSYAWDYENRLVWTDTSPTASWSDNFTSLNGND
jgi:YD repeat-containing protein